MSSYYNNIPIEEYINVEYANVDTINASTIKTENLYIDNIKSSDKVITQTLTLDNDDIESLTKTSNQDYTSDNKKICSKGYIDEKLNNITNNLSTCVKNNENQTLTNKFIMSNTSNEININKLKIKDFDDNNNIDTIEKIKTGGSSNNDTLTTKGYVDTQISSIPAPDLSECVKNNTNQTLTNKFIMSNSNNEFTANKLTLGTSKTITASTALNTSTQADDAIISTKYYVDDNNVGKKYLVGDVVKGEIFNNYTVNKASGNFSHCEGTNNEATGTGSHAEGYMTIASNSYSHAGGYWTVADQMFQTSIGLLNIKNNTDALLSVGNGTNNDLRSDALVVYSTGEVKINTTKSGTTPKLTLGTSKSITATTGASNSTQADDAIISTKYYVDNSLSNLSLGVGQTYPGSNNGEIFNSYSQNTASGMYSHAEGYNTTASNNSSHAGGYQTTASGEASFTAGYETIADQNSQTSIGKYNKSSNTNALLSVGNGTADNSRRDAFNVFSNGTMTLNNDYNVYYGPVNIRFEYNGSTNKTHTSSFGVIYSFPYRTGRIAILSNAKIYFNETTYTQTVYVDSIQDGNGNTYYPIARISDSNEYYSGGGFINGSNIQQQTDTNIQYVLQRHTTNAYKLVPQIYSGYYMFFFDNTYWCSGF